MGLFFQGCRKTFIKAAQILLIDYSKCYSIREYCNTTHENDLKYLLILGTPYMKTYLILFLCFYQVSVSIANAYTNVVIKHANQPYNVVMALVGKVDCYNAK